MNKEAKVSNQQDNKETYNRQNVPPSLDAALKRMDELEITISHIEVQLEHEQAGSFASEDDYLEWRAMAMKALAYPRGEKNFLEKWVNKQQPSPKDMFRQKQHESIAKRKQLETAQHNKNREEKLAEEQKKKEQEEKCNQSIQIVKTVVSELVNKIEAAYSPQYTNELLPQNLQEAKAQLVHLAAIKRELDTAMIRASAAWTAPTDRFHITHLSLPLRELIVKVINEIRIVKFYIKKESRPGTPLTAKLLCVQALKRAVVEGFVLSLEEQTALSEFDTDLSTVTID